MSSAFIFRATELRDPKLAIKSSMPGLREGIAWLILFYLITKDSGSTDRLIRPFEEYVDGQNKTKIRLTDEVKGKILALYDSSGIQDASVISSLTRAFNKCTLATTQMEPLIVAFEIYLQLAKCEFASTVKRPQSAERTGGERFGKSFKLTNAVRRLAYAFELLPDTFLYLMLEWISGRNLDVSDRVRKSMDTINLQLQEQFLDLSARTIFRIEDDDPKMPEHFFNTLGLYISLLRGSVVKLPSDKEGKGPLRILKNAVQSGLLPGLSFRGNEFFLDPMASYSNVKALIEERKTFEELSAIDFTGKGRSTPISVDENSETNPMRNVILYGVPGSGKSFKINEEHLQEGDYVERVVFHPEYMYANFIGQILPVVSKGEVSYEFVPGPFTEILQRAIANPDQRHVLIIEEINRGNAAAIFGDVFQLLDRDKSGASRYGIHNRDISGLIHGNVNSEIKIPPNLLLLATMNTSDQNVFTLDTAFQRRWSMEIVRNDLNKVPWANIPIAGTPVTWRAFVTEINRLITAGSDSLASSEDKRLGAFFASEDELSVEESRAFAEKVLKYLWDDAFKFNRRRIFLDAEASTLEDVIQAFVCAAPEKRWDSVFTSKVANRLMPVDDSSEAMEVQARQVDSYDNGIE